MRNGGKVIAGFVGLAVIGVIFGNDHSNDASTQAAVSGSTAERAEASGEPQAARRAKPEGVRVPDVVGQRLDAARDQVASRRLKTKAIGGGRGGIVVESKWEVCRTEPAAGRRVGQGTRVRLIVGRVCDDSSNSRQAGPAATSRTEASAAEAAPGLVAGGDLDCSQFDRQVLAQAYYDVQGGVSGDAAALDADRDGVACEGLP